MLTYLKPKEKIIFTVHTLNDPSFFNENLNRIGDKNANYVSMF